MADNHLEAYGHPQESRSAPLSSYAGLSSRCGSFACLSLQSSCLCFLAKQRRRARDLEHKSSRVVVKFAQERHASTLVIGDVRDVADGKHLATKSQQKIGLWAHRRQRQYITSKAEAAGDSVILIDEAYASQKRV